MKDWVDFPALAGGEWDRATLTVWKVVSLSSVLARSKTSKRLSQPNHFWSRKLLICSILGQFAVLQRYHQFFRVRLGLRGGSFVLINLFLLSSQFTRTRGLQCPLAIHSSYYLEAGSTREGLSESMLSLTGLVEERSRGHGGRVVTLLPPTSEARVRSPARPQVGKLVVACRWSAVYSTEP